jgi:uncharacterized lipoprotein YddW (UPF0748 family)
VVALLIAAQIINHRILSGMTWPKHKILFLLLQALALIQFDLAAQSNEVRGLWVDAFHPGFKSSDEVKQLLQDARAARFNTIFVEVRKRGDAYYQSRFEPQAGDFPVGFDPLAEIISQAHSGMPRLEVHAWMTIYPVWNSAKNKPTQANHPFLKHPEWLTRNRDGIEIIEGACQFDPGHPGVQQHLFNVAMDLVTRYDIDGLHLDHIRYPGNDWGYNPLAVKRFNLQYGRSGLPATNDLQWLQFRRNQVTALVRKTYLSSMAIKPKLKLSAATFTGLPSIGNIDEWPQSRAYASVLQDWLEWMQEGILDLNIPMSYFRQQTNGNDMARWQNFIVDHRYGHQAVIGLGYYLNSTSNNLVQLQGVHSTDALGNRPDGFGCYSYAAMCANDGFKVFPAAINQSASEETNEVPLFEPALTIPTMPWKETPQNGHLKGFVVDGSSKSGLDHAAVVLTGPVNKMLESDGTGFFGAANLPPGEYRVEVTSWHRIQNATLVSITPGTVSTVNFILSASPHASSQKKPLYPLRTKS